MSPTEMLLEYQYKMAAEIDTAIVAAVSLLRSSPGPWEPSALTEALVQETRVEGRWAQTAQDELIGHGVIQVVGGTYALNVQVADALYG